MSMGPMMPAQGDPRAAAAYDKMGQMLDGKQAQAKVNYRPCDNKIQCCATCEYFRGPDACAKVAGKISPQATCDLWESENEKGDAPAEEATE